MSIKSYLGNMSPENISEALSLKFNDGSLKGSVKSVIVGKTVMMMVMDFYLMRISSNVSVSLLIVPEETQTRITAVSSGGASGLLQLTFGSEKTVLKTIDRLMLDYGFMPETQQIKES